MRGLTAIELADDAGVSLATLARLERGVMPEPGLWMIARIAGALSVAIDEWIAG